MTQPEPIGTGSLKLIVMDDVDPATVARALEALVREEDLRSFGRAFLVYGDASPQELRDALAAAVPAAGLLVVEFERWSASGRSVDRAWLLRRGH